MGRGFAVPIKYPDFGHEILPTEIKPTEIVLLKVFIFLKTEYSIIEELGAKMA